jgi:phosphatidylglycerophosphate synthase
MQSSHIDSAVNSRAEPLEEALESAAERRRSLWQDYQRSLKPLAVEEPIDVWVHRPLAYALARALYPTSVSPNLVTLLSIVFGLASGAAMFVDFPGHLPVAGLCLFVSAIFDCADGQLARMRGTSSAFGRMLDGVADLIVTVAAVGGGMWLIVQGYTQPTWLAVVVLGLCVACAVTGSFHTGLYDHYKNVYLRLTNSRYREGESHTAAVERHRRTQGAHSIVARLSWPVYLFYVKSQESVVRRFDPYTVTELERLPPFGAERAAIYERHAASLMKIWRMFFGFGSLVFGVALFVALGMLEYYMAFRLVLLNALFFGYLVPAQRRASKAAFDEIGS